MERGFRGGRELHQVDLRDRADGARFGMMYYLMLLLPAPLLLSLQIRRPFVGLLLVLALFVTIGLQAWIWRSGKAERRHMVWPVVSSFILCAVQTSFFGPFMISPGAAAATAAIFLVSLRANAFARRSILALALGSIFLPAALELAGFFPRAYSRAGVQFLIAPSLFAVDERTSLVILATSAALTIGLTVFGVWRSVNALVT